MGSNTHAFAKRELDILVKSSTDPLNRPIIEPFIPELLALIDKFGKSGQSGGSAPFTASALSQAIKKLCLQEPICPVMGIDEEWTDVTDLCGKGKMRYQNKRHSAIFKDDTGQSWYLDAIAWKTQNGSYWGGAALLQDGTLQIKYRSKQAIKSFPFTPKTFYVDVIEKEVAPHDFEFYIKDKDQLMKVFKYYNLYED